jgi:hypothetical protein
VILKKKPSHVPDWAWDEYQQAVDMKGLVIFEVSKAARPKLSDEERDIKQRIISEYECKIIWSGIEKRKEKAIDIPSDRHALWLFANAKRFFLGPSKLDKISKSERKRLGEKVAKLSSDLQSTLLKVRRDEQVPLVMEESLATPFQYFLGSRSSLDHLNAEQFVVGTNKRNRELNVAIRGASREAFFSDHDFNVLTSLARGAKIWASTKPMQYRAEDSAHIYFVKSMGHYFKNHYGQPLLEQVAVLTNCLYMTAITKSDVSKILKF